MKVLESGQTDGDRVALPPGVYEFQAKSVQGGGVKVQFRDQDDEAWLDSGVSLSSDGATKTVIPSETVAVRAMASAAGAEAWLVPAYRSVGG